MGEIGWGFGITKSGGTGSGGTITGSGTTDTIPIFTGATALGDSVITWNGESFTASLLSGFFRFEDATGYIQIFPNTSTIRTNNSFLILEGTKGAKLTDGSGTATWEAGTLTLLEGVGAGLFEIRSASGDIEFTESGGGLQKIQFVGGVGAYTYSLPAATGTIALTSDISGFLPLSGGTMTGDIVFTNDNDGLDFQDLTGGFSDAHLKSRIGSIDGSDLMHPIIMAQDNVGADTNTFFGWRNGNNNAVVSAKSNILLNIGGNTIVNLSATLMAYNSTTIAQIAAGSGKVLISKEYADSVYIGTSLRNITTTATFATANETINCTANTFTVNLPTAVGIQGTIYTLVNSGTGTITLDPNGTETINGNTTIDLVQYVSRTVQSDGTNWIII